MVLCYNIFSIANNGAVYKFIIVLVGIYKMESI